MTARSAPSSNDRKSKKTAAAPVRRRAAAAKKVAENAAKSRGKGAATSRAKRPAPAATLPSRSASAGAKAKRPASKAVAAVVSPTAIGAAKLRAETAIVRPLVVAATITQVATAATSGKSLVAGAVTTGSGLTAEVMTASPASSAGTGPGPLGQLGDIGVVTSFPPQVIRNTNNFFDGTRAGRPVVRPDDLLALRVELQNLSVLAGKPGESPRLKKSGSGEAYLILHFPPQAITEETFFETSAQGTTDPKRPDGTPDKPSPGSEPLTGPPVRARVSGESRLACIVPDGFDVEYSLRGVLEAMQTLAPSVPANAAPPGPDRGVVTVGNLFTKAAVSSMTATQRASLTSFAARSFRIALVQGDAATLELRQATGGPGLKTLKPGTTLDVGVVAGVATVRGKPRPAEPTATQTSIELPWRLILSPHGGERWRHALGLVTSPEGRTELWHSRLVAPNSKGEVIEPPRPDPQRSVRAVWALTGEGSPKPMQGAWPTPLDIPTPNTSPFRMPLDDFDRFQIVHLSSNFTLSNYTPNAVSTNLLMLSTLGGWIDTRGAWDPPGLSVEEWVHRGSMGRDHYVRVVYKGFLFPFGHRVALVKVSERKFHHGVLAADGNPVKGNTAYLRQRLFIVIREQERKFVDPGLSDKLGNVFLHRQFPFSSIRIVTAVTPNLDLPDSPASRIPPVPSQRLFWPCVNGAPFAFQCVGTDLDGRALRFELPMIFMDNTLASPRIPQGGKLIPDWASAETGASTAQTAWREAARAGRRVAQLKQQRVAMAPSLKAGDTSIQADEISFDAFVEKNNQQLRDYSDNLARPVFYPSVDTARVRIAALTQLTGSTKTNKIVWNTFYLKNGFNNNQGQVFVDVISEPGMAQLDFSSQGDRSGGFIQPNLKPSALSRLTGPVTGNVANFISGTLNGADSFPTTLSDLPLPLLFGCIPLGEVIQTVTELAGKPGQVPKFGSEASTQIEAFINGLVRLFDFVSKLADQPGRIADAALVVVKSTLQDLLDQAQGYAQPLVSAVKTRISELTAALNAVLTHVQDLFDKTIDVAPGIGGLTNALTAAQAAVINLRDAANASPGGVSLPAGFRQSLLQVAVQLETIIADVGTVTTLIAEGKALFAALDAIVGHPEALGDLLSNPAQLKAKLEAVEDAITPLRMTIANSRLLDGAPRQVVLDAIDGVLQVLDTAEDLLQLLEMLAGDELTIRFDWNPPIANWALPGANPTTDALFRANDKHGFLVAVEAKVKKNGQSAPKIGVVCSLKSFDLVLIAPASFIELNFEKIEFRIDSSAKMDVDVLLSDIKFVGPLSFVETLRDLIPLDGFTDPPYLDITPQGIDAGFTLALPNISMGVLNLSNLSVGAGLTVPFIGQPLSVRFMFCSREQPFNLTVSLFGGGGFFGITLDPHGIQLLEAAFEFGASISVNFGVASGGVYVMAGFYFRMEKDACSLTGYFRLGGYVSVLGLISASLELYLELRYEFSSGKCVGLAKLTIEIEIFMFSMSVTITCERKFAGSNGDPSFRDLMGVKPALSLAEELAAINNTTEYAWREYCEAFA